MSVKSRTYHPQDDDPPGPRRRQKRRIGFVSGGGAEHAFVWLLRLAGVALILVSVVGSFYGLQGREAEAPLKALPAMAKGWPWLLGALAVQAFLSVGQWGSRQRAQGTLETKDGQRHRVGGDPRFWIVYLALLIMSAALNWIAYGPHLLQWGIHWALAALAVIVGDAMAELVIVVDE